MFREFKDIVSYIRNNESGIAGDIYVGSRFLIARNCNPFFKAAFEKERPVKANVVCLVIVRRGWCEPVIGLKKYRCTAGDMLFLNWGVAVEADNFGVDSSFDCILMTEAYLKTIFGGRPPERFLSPDLCFSIHTTEQEQVVGRQFMETLYNLAHLDSVNDSTLDMLFASTLRFADSLYSSRTVFKSGGWSRNKQTIERFVRLVNDNARTEHELDFYASQLCISAHYLGMVVKKETGLTAKEWIGKTLTMLLQLELRCTNKSQKMIADEFGFMSLSSLCKFFKRRTGITTTEYRMLPEDELK